MTYAEIDPRFGSWGDIERIGRWARRAARRDGQPHLAPERRIPRLRATWPCLRARRPIPHVDKVWPAAGPAHMTLARIFLRQAGSPFSTVDDRRTGEREMVWTTFGTADWSEQIDLDLTSPAARGLITYVAQICFATGGPDRPAGRGRVRRQEAGHELLHGRAGDLRVPRLDDNIGRRIRARDPARGPRRYATHERMAAHGFWTYDFVLPGLVLHAFRYGDARRLAAPPRALSGAPVHHARLPRRHPGTTRPRRCSRACREMLALAEQVRLRGGNVNRILSVANAADVDVHQLNCTYYSALGEDDDRYIAARAIQLFARAFRRSTTSDCSAERTISRARPAHGRWSRHQSPRLRSRRDR